MKRKISVLSIGILLIFSGMLIVVEGSSGVEEDTEDSDPPTLFFTVEEVIAEDVIEGEELEVTATIKNERYWEHEEDVAMRTDPNIGTDRKTISLDSREEKTVTFTTGTSIGDAGSYGATVSPETGQAVLDSFNVLEKGEVAVPEVTADDVGEGENVKVNATIHNTGEGEVTQTIDMATEPDLGEESRDVRLPGGESTNEIFQIETSTGDVGDYNLTVSSEDDSAQTTFTVLEAPFFDVSGVTADDVIGGESVEVTATIENTGVAEDTQIIGMTTDPFLGEDSTSVTLDGGNSTTETLTVNTSVDDIGSYTVTVSSDDDSDQDTFEVLEGAYFEVSEVDADDVMEGDRVYINATIQNLGAVNDTQVIMMDSEFGGADEEVQLEGGESITETFTIRTYIGDAGSYTVNISSEDDYNNDTFEVLEEPSFEIIELTAHENRIVEGESIEVTATIENTGDVEETQTIELTTDPDISEDSVSVTLDGGENTTEMFTIDTSEGDADTYTVMVSSEDDADQDTFEVLKKAYFSVIDLTAYDEMEGESVEVTATIENTGGVNDTQTVELITEPDLGEESITITLESGDSTTETFFIDTFIGDGGIYTVTVSSEDDENTADFEVLEEDDDDDDDETPPDDDDDDDETPPDDDDDDDDDNDDDDTPGFTATLLLIAAVIAVLAYHKKKR